MRVCFLTPELRPSGGIAVVLGHARRLRESGACEVDVVSTGPARDDALTPDAARERSYDVAVATWWTTAAALHRLRAERRALFVQGPDYRFFPVGEVAERAGALAALGLADSLLLVGGWMGPLVEELRPGVPWHHAPNGIDKAVFAPAEPRPFDGVLRVLVEGQPEHWFKGMEEAVRAVRAMREPATVTVVAAAGGEAGRGLGADRVAGGLDPAGMAGLYAEHDVVLKLSRFEGLGLAPLEGFHVGVPCVVTPYGGHAEYVVHGENGAVVGFDDEPGTAAWLDALARDTDLRARLRAGALATAERWPDERRSTELLLDALQSVRHAPAATAGELVAYLASTLGLSAALADGRLAPLERERALEALREEIRELYASRGECAEMLEDARRQLAEVTDSRAYRAALAGRRLIDRVRR